MHMRQFITEKLQKSVVKRNSILLQDSVTLPPMETVGDRVRAAREARDLTMKQLARLIGKNESYISELERGGIRRGSQLHRIAEVLGAPLAWIESGAGKTSEVLNSLRDSSAEDGGATRTSGAASPAGGAPVGADGGTQKTTLDPKLLATAISLAQRVFQEAGRVPNVEQLAAASVHAYTVLLRGVGMKVAKHKVNDMFARNGILRVEEDSSA